MAANPPVFSTPPLIVPAGFRIIAHRGASGYAPENTLAAIDLAAQMGVREVEIDVRLSADGVLVLCHDDTLERYGHGKQTVEETPYKDLASLDMGSWFSPYQYAREPMPRLEDVMRKHGEHLTYHIELKGDRSEVAPAVADLVAHLGLLGSVIITSFHLEFVRAACKRNPHLRGAWLVDQITPEILQQTKEDGLFQLCPRADQINAEHVNSARKQVAEVRTWGLKGTLARDVLPIVQRVIDAGGCGTTINNPDWLSARKNP